MSNVQIAITVSAEQAQKELEKLTAQFEGLMKLAKSFSFGNGINQMMEEAKKMQTTIQGMEKELRQVSQTTKEIGKTAKEGFAGLKTELEETQKRVVSLKWSFKDILKDAISLANFQLRWYAARNVIFGIPRGIGQGIGFESEIDKAQAQLLRYAAMEGEVSNLHRRTVEDITTYSRQLAVNMPIAFEEVIKSSDRLLAAGADIDTVKGSLQSFAKLQVAFPEIEMEKFTNAIIGFLNTFRKTPGLKDLENDAQRLQVILDKVTVALAKGVIAPKDINVVIQHLGQMSQAAGFSIDQMLALSVMVTNLGSKAGPAGRALRGLIDSLATPKGIENLKLIGVQLDKSKTIAEQFKTIIEGLRKAVGTGEGGLTLGGMEFLRGIAPTERRAALIALIRELETYEGLVRSISDSQGALDRTATIMTDTLSGQWQIFKNLTKEMGAAFTQSELLKDGLGFLIGTLKVLGFMLSGIVGVTSLAVDGFKFLYHTIRLITNPLERVIISVGYLLQGDYKGALSELKRMPQVFDEHLFKADDALRGSLDRAAKEVQTIQDVLFGKSKFTGGKGEIKGSGILGEGVPSVEDAKAKQKAYKDMLKDIREYQQFLKGIYDIEKQITELQTSDTMKTAQAEATRQAANLEHSYKLGEITIEEFYKQKDLLRQQDIANEASALQETTQRLKAEIDNRIEHMRQAMQKMAPEDALKATREIFTLYKRQELLDAQEIARINELIRKGEVEGTKEALQLAFEKWQTEKNYKEQLIRLTYDSTTAELIGIQRTEEEAKRKFSSLLPLIEKLSKKAKEVWLFNTEQDILKNQKSIYDITGDRKLSLSTQVDIYGKELDRLSSQIKQRENDLMIARITGKDAELVQKDLDRIRMQYEYTTTQMQEIQNKLTGSPMEGFIKGLENYSRQAKTTYEQMEEAGLRVAQAMENAFMNFFDYTSKGFMKFGELATNILNEIYKETLRVLTIRPLTSAFTKALGGLLNPASAMSSYTPASLGSIGGENYYLGMSAFPGRASGGDVYGYTPYWVGERGPEIFIPKTSGTIIPNHAINQGGDTIVNIQMENKTGLPLQLKQLGTRMDEKSKTRTIIMDLLWTDPEFRYAISGAR